MMRPSCARRAHAARINELRWWRQETPVGEVPPPMPAMRSVLRRDRHVARRPERAERAQERIRGARRHRVLAAGGKVGGYGGGLGMKRALLAIEGVAVG